VAAVLISVPSVLRDAVSDAPPGLSDVN
jgi:hypothetical protein